VVTTHVLSFKHKQGGGRLDEAEKKTAHKGDVNCLELEDS